MPKSETQKRIDARPGLDTFYDDSAFDVSETSTPNTPSGVNVRAVVDGILIQVDFIIDTAHLHPRFQAFIVYAKPIGTASAEPLEVARFSDSSYVWQQPRGGYTGWQIALSAVSNTGYESALTSYYNCILSTFFDDFGSYGGAVSSATENLWWLQIAACESAEAWFASGGIGTVSDDATYFEEGAQGKRMTSELTAGNYYGSLAYEWTPTIDLSVENRFTDDDYITLIIFASVEIADTVRISMSEESPTADFYYYNLASLAAGWNYIKILKSDFSSSGSPDWAVIGTVAVYGVDADEFFFTADAWYIVKADPDDAATFNPTGYQWDFTDGTWLILPGDRTGEPSYAFSLAHVESGVANDDYLATAVNIGVPNGVVSAGIMLKNNNGAAGLTFRLDDDTLGSEDCLTAELDTTANTITLNQYTAGAKTELATATYACDPDNVYFVGVDFRDPQHQNRVDVYIASQEYDLFTGDTLALSYSSDTPWPNGHGVGVLNHACNSRFVNFRAGSPMTADYAHRAGIAYKALVAIPGSIDHDDLGSVTADQHHTAFVGLEDNAATAITPAADDRIQITDDGKINADANGNTLALSIGTAAAGTIQPDDAAAEGIAATLSRSDHKHAIAGAVAGSIAPDDAAAEGIATSFSRSDHTHGITAAVAGSITPDASAAEGVATSFSRSDHVHGITAAAPGADSVNVAASAEGDATSFARSNHTHNLDESIAPTWTGIHIHSNADVKHYSGTDLIVFSDAGITEKARIDGATGNFTTAGSVDGVDVSAHTHSGAGQGGTVAHASLGSIGADDHHAGFIGLEDTAATAVTPAADDRIQIEGTGGVTVTAGANKLTISAGSGAGGVDHGSLNGLGDDDHTQYALLAGRSGGEIFYGGTQAADALTLHGTSGGAPGGGDIILTRDTISIGTTGTGTIAIGGKVWLVGTTGINMDFTGTGFDTDAELQAYGLRLSDADTPFPTTLTNTVSGTWAHSAGNGWAATVASDAQGAGILIPLMRPGNWELSLILNYAAADVAHRFTLKFGYITTSNHVGAYGQVADSNASATEVEGSLYTNDGDDTFTGQYTSADVISGVGSWTYKFRCQNGCIGFYDEYDNAYHYYTGRQDTTVSYTAASAFLQIIKQAGSTLSAHYLASLTLTYLL